MKSARKEILYHPSWQSPPWRRATDTVLAARPRARQTRCVARVTCPITVLVLSWNTGRREDKVKVRCHFKGRHVKNNWCQTPNVKTWWAKCGEAMQNLSCYRTANPSMLCLYCRCVEVYYFYFTGWSWSFISENGSYWWFNVVLSLACSTLRLLFGSIKEGSLLHLAEDFFN